jgi:hypothetical protein
LQPAAWCSISEMAGELIFEDKEAIHVTEFLSN